MTTFGISAECGRLVEYDTVADLLQLNAQGLLQGALPLGGGSNMLFTKPTFNGTVIHCRNKQFSIERHEANGTATVEVSAGCVLDSLCDYTASQGLWGLENLSGIPGEIGGAAVQNVGAYGAEFADVVKQVTCFSPARNEIVVLTGEQCRYAYRDSIFKHLQADEALIVVSATIELSIAPKPNLRYAALAHAFANTPASQLTPTLLRNEVLSLRHNKLPDPKQVGSAGSFFKNPVVSLITLEAIEQRLGITVPGHEAGIDPTTGEQLIKLSAAWLIDKSGCKSFSIGGASLWQNQPLVLVNTNGTATGSDILALEQKIIATVKQTTGVTLSPEVIHI
jgi:UDP-N-acetylmuramate dehydrogenase